MDYAAVLPYFVAVLTGLLGWFSAQFTGLVQLQKTLLDASRQWVADSQAQHARDGVRITELESEVLRQRGTINQGLQREESLQRLLDKVQEDAAKLQLN